MCPIGHLGTNQSLRSVFCHQDISTVDSRSTVRDEFLNQSSDNFRCPHRIHCGTWSDRSISDLLHQSVSGKEFRTDKDKERKNGSCFHRYLKSDCMESPSRDLKLRWYCTYRLTATKSFFADLVSCVGLWMLRVRFLCSSLSLRSKWNTVVSLNIEVRRDAVHWESCFGLKEKNRKGSLRSFQENKKRK